jgi:hypothetical protein
VRIFQYLDGIFDASEKAEGRDQRKMFYRHSRYFILDILSRRCKPLLNKVEIDLSDADKKELSRNAIYLSEFIYATSELRFKNDHKGFLSIFKSLTDVEPFKREIMDKLARRDAKAENPNIPTN